MGRAATVNAEGQASWSALTLHRLEPSVRAALTIIDPSGRELNETDTWSMLRPAIAAVIVRLGGKTAVPHADVLAEVDTRAAKHFRLPSTDYIILTSLSVDALPMKRAELTECRISPLGPRGDRFPTPKSLHPGQPHHKVLQECVRFGYQWACVSTRGRTIHAAFDDGMRALHLLRAIWTLFATRGSWRISSSQRTPKPVGTIRLGPVHTVHRPDGGLAEDLYWYEPSWDIADKLFNPSTGWDPIEKQRRWAVARLRRHPFGSEVQELLVRYVNALDHADHDVTFLHLWAVLEHATDTVGAAYDRTIERAASIFTDRGVAMEVLESLRLSRNQYVHASRSGERRDQLAYSIKSILDAHLIRLIKNDFRAESIVEHAQCLGLAADTSRLERQRRQLSRVICLRRRERATKRAQDA